MKSRQIGGQSMWPVYYLLLDQRNIAYILVCCGHIYKFLIDMPQKLSSGISYLYIVSDKSSQHQLLDIGKPMLELLMKMRKKRARFAWPEPIAVRNTAAVQGIVGIFTLLNYIAYICFKMEKFINFRMSCMFALTIMILFHLVTYSWPFLPNSIVLNYNSELINATDQNVGCNVNKFTWCESLTQVNVWIYFITYIIAIGIALPTMNITMTTLFSKILGPRRQGTQQGVLQMFGSGARMVGPIAISTLYSDYGPRMAWMMEIVVISSTLLLWCIFYRRMVPLRCAIHSDYEIISTDDKSMKSEKTVNNVV
uniref:Uncharacterized protein n=2 Tax=Acrobeloides nanus TaxID=290746 RepID=A0A914CRX6_9BILA